VPLRHDFTGEASTQLRPDGHSKRSVAGQSVAVNCWQSSNRSINAWTWQSPCCRHHQ